MFRQAAIRSPIAVGAALLISVLWADLAAADYGDGAVCDDSTDTCEVSAGFDGSESDSAGGAPGDAGGGGDSASEDSSAAGTGSGEAGVCPNWVYELVDSDSGYYMGAFAGERPSEDHQLMGRSCTMPGSGTTMASADWVLVDDNGIPVVDPAVLAQDAIDRLRLPKPKIMASPAEYQLVRLPTWLHVGGDSWSAQSASASVPGLTVTATARPVKATWDMGDGSTVLCEGAGTKWTPKYSAKDSSPDCGHTYTRSSAHHPSGEHAVSVTVEWAVSWSGGGVSGTAPGMSTTASTSWPVAESQAITGR